MASGRSHIVNDYKPVGRCQTQFDHTPPLTQEAALLHHYCDTGATGEREKSLEKENKNDYEEL